MTEPIRIFDTTLRDGEQSAGVCFSARDKLEIAARLASLGVDGVGFGNLHSDDDDEGAGEEGAEQTRC